MKSIIAYNVLFYYFLKKLPSSVQVPCEQKRELRNFRNSLIFNVDQPGLEPGTSRL